MTSFLLGCPGPAWLSVPRASEGRNGKVNTAPLAFRNCLLETLIDLLRVDGRCLLPVFAMVFAGCDQQSKPADLFRRAGLPSTIFNYRPYCDRVGSPENDSVASSLVARMRRVVVPHHSPAGVFQVVAAHWMVAQWMVVAVPDSCSAN